MGAFDCDCIENLMGRFEEERKADRIQSCIDHINTAVDVDPWAKELVVEMGKEILEQLNNSNDCISRQAAIDAVDRLSDKPIGYLEAAIDTLVDLPPVQPEPSEMTDEQAILHLQSTGWMQNHDREMYESGLREQLADDSGGYDSLIPCEDTISRQDAIRWVKTECNPYGKPTLDFESGKLVIEHLKQMPSVQPVDKDINVSCKDCISRQMAIDICHKNYDGILDFKSDGRTVASSFEDIINSVPSVQPEIMPDGTLHITVSADVADIDRILLSQAGTHSGDLYYKDAQSEPQWIPVSERLPEDEYVLISKKPTKISGSKWSVTIAIRTADPRSRKIQWRDIGFGVIQDDKVLAWMPLPEPYREEGRTDD